MPCVSGRPWQLRSSVWTRTAYGVGLWLRLSVDQSLATSTMHQQNYKSIFWAVTLADVLAEEAASEKAAPELPVLRCGRGIC